MIGWQNIIPFLLILAGSCNCKAHINIEVNLWFILGQYVIKDVWGEPPNVSDWTTSLGDNGYTYVCNGQTIIGGYDKFGAGAWAKKTYSGLSAHNKISLEFDAYFIDTWDGGDEKFLVDVDDDNVYHQSHSLSNSTGDLCGLVVKDLTKTVVIESISHNSTSITLHFHSGLNQPAYDESFGFKNIQITVHLCALACTACFGNSASECYSCADGWYLSGTTCLNSCPTGYWGNNVTKTCQQCFVNSGSSPYSCAACSTGANHDQCDSCDDGTYLYPSQGPGQCLNPCPDGYWGDNATKICEPCYIDSGSSPFSCATCSKGGNSNECDSCNDGTYLHPSPGPGECLRSCPKGFWGDSSTNTCEPCYTNVSEPFSCATCSAGLNTNCTSCNSGSFLYPVPEGQCVRSCPGGYWGDTATKTCKPCYSDSTSSLFSCVTCSGGSKSDCKSCRPGAYLYPDPTGQCLTTCPYGYWGDDMTNVCRQCTPYMQNAPPPCAAIDDANDENMASGVSSAMAAASNTLQSANAVSGMSYINLLLSLSAIESIANMQYFNVNHSAIALGAYSGLSSSIIPNWIAKLNHLSEENAVFNYGVFEKNHFSALYLDNNGDFLVEIFIYGGLHLLMGVISCTIKKNLARTRVGKVYAITTGLFLSNVFGHIQTLILFSLIQILKVSLVVDAYSGVSYLLAYFTLTSVAALHILCFFKLKAIFEKKSKSKYTIRRRRYRFRWRESIKGEDDEWNETKYEMIFGDFKETSRSSFFFSYWIAAFNIVYILLIFTLQSVPVIQCLSVIVLTISFTIISAIVNPMKKKSANFIYFFNYACILFVGFVNLAIAIKEAVTGDHSSNKLAGWVIFFAVMANTGMNILIGFGGLLIQLFQVIQNRIKKRGNNKEKDSKTRAKRTKSSTRKKEDTRKQDSSRLLVQKNNFYHNSFRAIDLSTAASIPSNSLKPRVIMKTRKITAYKIQPYHIPNSLSGSNTKPIHSQRKEMSQNSYRSAKSRGIKSTTRLELTKVIKHH